jgi:hypothetical protein
MRKTVICLAFAFSLTVCASPPVMADIAKYCTQTAQTCYDSNNQASNCTVTTCTYPDGHTTRVVKTDPKKNQRPVNPSALTPVRANNKTTTGDLGTGPSKTPANQSGLLPLTANKTLGGGGPSQTSTKPLH